jgi:glycosyltransferase involved in cell wall biosynthesis
MRTSVLFLPKWYPHKSSPFDGIFVRRHAEAVSSYVDVYVLFAAVDADLKKGLYYAEEKMVNPHLVEMRWYYRKRITGWNPIDRSLKVGLYFLCVWKGYVYLKKKYGLPQLVHVHLLRRTGIFALFLSWLEKLPIVYTEHWSGYQPQDGNYKGWFRKRLTRYFISKSKYVMPVTQHLADAMQGHGLVGNYVIVPNVVDTDFFVPPPFPQNNLEKTAIHISNFDPRAKNVEGMLEVISRVAKHRSDFKCWIVGHSSERFLLEKKAKDLDILNKHVFFFGSKMGTELVETLQKADFLFMFSNFESQPCVILEAMACGKPILATKVGGIPEMVDGTKGMLTEPKDIHSMTIAFETMLDRSMQMSSEDIRSFAVNNYSYFKVGKQITDLYQKAIQHD